MELRKGTKMLKMTLKLEGTDVTALVAALELVKLQVELGVTVAPAASKYTDESVYEFVVEPV
jgi:hypothetical protein